MSLIVSQALFSTGKNDWATPQELFDELDAEFYFTLDPCATPETAKCAKFYTEKDNGLVQDWTGETVFCNPPYSDQQQTEWVRKCYEHGLRGGVAVMLIPARTDTKRFHEYIYGKAEVRFIKGRLKFGGCENSAPFPSMIVVFGKEPIERRTRPMGGINLYDYQLDAIDRMKNGCILCGGVGSGKSRTSLAYYYQQQGGDLLSKGHTPMKHPKDLYIITTARKRDTLEWEGELAPFLLSTHPEANYYKNKVVVDSWNNIAKYTDVKDSFFIFDEQRVIGYGAWTKAFLKIAKVNNWILLSATPGDTWQDYIPVFIANGFYRNKTQFVDEHVNWDRFAKFPKIDSYRNTGRLIRLRDRILVTMDFERKTVAHHESIPVSYDISRYKDIMRKRWNPWEDRPIETAAELCMSLRRVVNSDESRAVAVLEILEDHPKAIIFYSHNYELDILRSLGYPEGTEIAEWNGHKHQEIPTGDKWVYLVQYTAGCEGWNCITTDTIIFYSQQYSYKVATQAAGRIDRLTTPYTDLWYYHIKSYSGIDLAIAKALNAKKNFNEGKFVGWSTKPMEVKKISPQKDERRIAELIARRRRQLLVHSIIYYKMNDNIIPDATWSKWGQELEELQAKYPEIAAKQPYAKEFEGFDHSTGMSLPLNDPWAVNKARQLLQQKENGNFDSFNAA